MPTLPDSVDIVVIGTGPGGAACASELADSGSLLILEAGPDYGPYDSGRWPADLLEAFDLAESHGWGYTSESTYADRIVPFSRARVMGGCSSHNGCAAIWGHRLDYDNWAALGNPGWTTEDLIPYFAQVNKPMRVRRPAPAEITPFHQLMLDSAKSIGIPMVADLNDLDDPIGMAASPANIWNGIRWNAGFAFIDPIRAKPNVTVVGDALVHRVLFENKRVVGLNVFHDGAIHTIRTSTVVVAGGTYNSPALLLQSGIGPGGDLRKLGIPVTADLPGVGQNLHDHPAVYLEFTGSDRIRETGNAWRAENWYPEEQSIAKLRSSQTTEAFDIHIYPEGGPYADQRTAWNFVLPVACMTPKSRGSLTLRSSNPTDRPRVDHNYLGDPDGHDLAVIADGFQIARQIAGAANTDTLLGEEFSPGANVNSDTEIREWITGHVHHYFHAAGTCKMGPSTDPNAVVDASGNVRGIAGLYIADCSIMPQVPRANTNIPAAVVGAKIGRALAQS
jgi:choline dehydrogenase